MFNFAYIVLLFPVARIRTAIKRTAYTHLLTFLICCLLIPIMFFAPVKRIDLFHLIFRQLKIKRILTNGIKKFPKFGIFCRFSFFPLKIIAAIFRLDGPTGYAAE